MEDDRLLGVLDEAVSAIRRALGAVSDWGLAGTGPGQHYTDLAADAAAVSVLVDAGLGVLSEESGHHHPERAVTVVLDPVDGSTNAHHGLPWYAASLCAVDAGGPRAAVVVNLASGTRYQAVRGAGATRDGRRLTLAPRTGSLAQALVALSGWPGRHLGWYQYRALGAVALDLCAVADGTVDAYVDCSVDAHGPWDYLGALLVCREVGVAVVDVTGRDLVVLDHEARRTPVAASNPELLAEVMAARTGEQPTPPYP
ncbi:MAG: inositol monophosphatase family protein [Acidimicrobiales bacterium]